MSDARRLVDKLWSYCNVLRDDGVGTIEYVEQLTHLLFLKMAHERATRKLNPQLVRAALPHMRAQGGGRVLQISSLGGQVAIPGSSLYHATKWGIEGFLETVAQEVAVFGLGCTIVEPGGARTGFRSRSAIVGPRIPAYDSHLPAGSTTSSTTRRFAHRATRSRWSTP